MPAARLLQPLLTWSDPDTVYLTYGKLWLPVLAALTVCAWMARRLRRPRGVERVAWGVSIVGYGLLTLSVIGDYFTPWIDESFTYIGVPGAIGCLAGSTALGICLFARRYRPVVAGVLLAGSIPLLLLITQVTSLGNALLPIIWSVLLVTRWLLRDRAADVGTTDPAYTPVTAER